MRPSSLNLLYALMATLLMMCWEKMPTASALPTSSSDTIPPQSNLQSRSVDNWYACFDKPITMHRRAKYNDCARAAAQLPNLIEARTFHRGGDLEHDPYALPKIKVHNSCQIKVDSRFGRADETSWLGIDMALTKIMAACSGGYGQHETTGGEIVAGSQDFIIVTVERTSSRALKAAAAASGNDTAVATE